jgi:hypothetical protein
MVEARSSASHKFAPTVHPAGLAPISNTAHSRSPGLRVDASTVAFPAARPVAWSRMKLTAYSCGGSSRIGPEPARHSRFTSLRRHCALCLSATFHAGAQQHRKQSNAARSDPARIVLHSAGWTYWQACNVRTMRNGDVRSMILYAATGHSFSAFDAKFLYFCPPFGLKWSV